MSYRKRTKSRLDKKVFSFTAKKSKKVNLVPKSMRGGIRL